MSVAVDIILPTKVKITKSIPISSEEKLNKFAYDFSMQNQLNYTRHKKLVQELKKISSNRTGDRIIDLSGLHLSSNLTYRPKSRPKSCKNSYKKIIGPLIYDRCVEYQEKTKQKIEEIKSQIIESDDELNTFSPKINPISTRVKNYRQKKGAQHNNGEMISNYKSYLKEKIEKLREKHNKETYRECVFIPKTNKKKYPSTTTDSKQSIFDELYYDYAKRKEKLIQRSIAQKSYTFRPTINNSSLSSNRSQPFLRLYNYAKKYNENKKKLYDNTDLNNITQYTYTNRNSNDILKRKKENVFKQIFRLLDQDEDGFITRVYVDTRKVDKEVLEIIMPIIRKLRLEDEMMSEKDFVSACEKLYDTLMVKERNTILSFDVTRKNTSKNVCCWKSFSDSVRVYKFNQ